MKTTISEINVNSQNMTFFSQSGAIMQQWLNQRIPDFVVTVIIECEGLDRLPESGCNSIVYSPALLRLRTVGVVPMHGSPLSKSRGKAVREVDRAGDR